MNPRDAGAEKVLLYNIMKKREEIITDMCYTYRHDYGLDKTTGRGDLIDMISSGTTEQEREWIWALMAQIFDNVIAPNMEFKDDEED